MVSRNGTEPSSFRDPSGSVFYSDDRVLRGLDARGAADWEALAATSFFRRSVDSGQVIGTRPFDAVDSLLESESGRWHTVLEHDPIPFVSYPYEWSFGMLRDAAITHLEVLLAALDERFTTKDGYAYNVQFRGASPVFIDVGSFEPIGAGGPWVGYRQFCQTMLYPLMLEAHLGVPFQRFLRGHLEGLESSDMRRLLGVGGLVRKGSLRHVLIHDLLASGVNRSSQATRQQLSAEGAGVDLSRAMATKLLSLVRSLTSKKSDSGWKDYRTTCSYSDDDTRAKKRFVETVAEAADASLVFDLGCNDGEFSRIAAKHADHVVAVDFDPVVVDHLHRELSSSGRPTNILPLVLDLTDPSPARGWRGMERKAFFERTSPDLVLALAVVHHLTIGANIPLSEVVDFLASFRSDVVVEFVEPHDPMAERLLSNKPAGTHDDYRTDVFESLLSARFEVLSSEALPGKSRRLYSVRPRS